MFKAELKGLNKVKAQFVSANANLHQIIESELAAAGAQWVAQAKRDAPVDQGTLKGGITYRQSGMLVEIFSNAFYSPFMEFGTKGKYRAIPGTEQLAAQFRGFKGGDFGEFLRTIVEWVRRKGIAGRYSVKTRRRVGSKAVQQQENLSVAWPIAMSILKNGVTPHPFFFKQADTVWPDMIRRIEKRLQSSTKAAVIMPGSINRPRIVTV